jgi:dTDP-4-amino-4,6-dideoxygalactose transaminase
LFPFRYQEEAFNGLPREMFLRALRAEGIPCSDGYRPLNKMPFLKNAFQTKNFKIMYPKEMLDYDKYMEQNQCPENDRVCDKEAVWFAQSMLLGTKSDMDDIATALRKVHDNASKIKSKV